MKQNQHYYECKAIELLEKRKHDPLSLASANLLFKSLNMEIDKFLTSPNSLAEHVARQSKPQIIKSKVVEKKQDRPFVIEQI